MTDLTSRSALGVWVLVILISAALVTSELCVPSASPLTPGQPRSAHIRTLTYGRLWPLFKSSQTTDGACIASALTLLHWQSPLWKQEEGGEIRNTQSLWQNVWFPYMRLPWLTVQPWKTQSACLGFCFRVDSKGLRWRKLKTVEILSLLSSKPYS